MVSLWILQFFLLLCVFIIIRQAIQVFISAKLHYCNKRNCVLQVADDEKIKATPRTSRAAIYRQCTPGN